ncbi:MAG: YajQ family cyclic di-GMP-binding protein [bacterium]|nr:YajQ family cyclic di-GMP-binding protein [bacterium]
MAKDFSFDVVSDVDLNVLGETVNVAMREISNRFDFKGTGVDISFDKAEKVIIFLADSDFQAEQLRDILISKISKRGISPKVLTFKKQEKASGDKIRNIENLVCGIEQYLAKEMVKDIKGFTKKVQVSIQSDKLRVSGREKDTLQEVMNFIKEKNYAIPLQFENYR